MTQPLLAEPPTTSRGRAGSKPRRSAGAAGGRATGRTRSSRIVTPNSARHSLAAELDELVRDDELNVEARRRSAAGTKAPSAKSRSAAKAPAATKAPSAKSRSAAPSSPTAKSRSAAPARSRTSTVGATALDPQLEAAPQTAPRRQERTRSRDLRVVEPRPRWSLLPQRRRRLLLVVGLAAVSAVVFLLVYLHVESAQKQFEIDTLTAKQQTEIQQFMDLRLEVAQANSPNRIIQKATALGMTEPASIRMLTAAPGSLNSTEETSSTPVANGATAPGGVTNWSQVQSLVGANS